MKKKDERGRFDNAGTARISRAAIIINIMGLVVCSTETTLTRENLNYIRFLR